MAAQLRQISIRSPGSEGLSSEISPFQASTEFALVADNAVVDRVGRLKSREAFSPLITKYNGISEDWDVVRLARIQTQDSPVEIDRAEWGVSEFGTSEFFGYRMSTPLKVDQTVGLIGEGNNFVSRHKSQTPMGDEIVPAVNVQYKSYVGFYQDGDELKVIDEIRPLNGLMNACIVSFNGDCYFFSRGEEVMVWDGTTAKKLSDVDGYYPAQDDKGVIAPIIDGDIACAAYGRLWVSGVNGDYQTVYFSDMLLGMQWYDGTEQLGDDRNTAGIIDVKEYWPNGDDTIMGIAAHNGFLIIFGRDSILIYSGAQGDPAGDPTTGFGGLKMEDAIRNVGLLNQDAMCNIGTDHLFADSLGIRSLGRVIQEKSSPLTEPSMNIASIIRPLMDTYKRTVKLIHMPSKSLVLCLFPAMRSAYVFQLGRPSSTGGLRVTRWTDCDFMTGITIRTELEDYSLLGGRDSKGLLVYDGYKQSSDYVFTYESTVIAGADDLMRTVIPKSASISYHGGSYEVSTDYSQDFNITWGFGAEMNYSRKLGKPKGATGFQTRGTSLNGTGEMLRVGFNSVISGTELSVQQITLNILPGRMIV